MINKNELYKRYSEKQKNIDITNKKVIAWTVYVHSYTVFTLFRGKDDQSNKNDLSASSTW